MEEYRKKVCIENRGMAIPCTPCISRTFDYEFLFIKMELSKMYKIIKLSWKEGLPPLRQY